MHRVFISEPPGADVLKSTCLIIRSILNFTRHSEDEH